MVDKQDATALADRIELAKVALITEGRDEDGEYETTDHLEPDDRYLIAQALRAFRATSQTPDAVREPQIYTAELLLNGKYTWCIVKALPRVETVIQEFGYGPDAYRTAETRLPEIKALYAHPQPQQADGRRATEINIEGIIGDCVSIDALPWKNDDGSPALLNRIIGIHEAANQIRAALQQSPATKD